MQFAKLFTIRTKDNPQVLIYRELDNETSKPVIHERTVIHGVVVNLKHEYSTDQNAKNDFDCYDQLLAEKFYIESQAIVVTALNKDKIKGTNIHAN